MKTTPAMTENMLRDAIVELARRLGWLYYFTSRSDHSPAGFPDLCLVRGGRLLFAELKVGRNTPTAEQYDWMAALSLCGVEVAIWRETDWHTGVIEEALR